MSPQQLGRVVFWMTGTLLSFSVMAVSVRGLAGALSIFEILSIRSASGVLIVLALVLLRPELRSAARPRRMGMHLLRNGVHYASQYAWALSITLLPFATVFALEFTMPAWTTLLAALLLGERLTASRVGAIVLGVLGVLVIVRPGLAAFQPAALIVLAAAFGYAASNIATKMLTSTEPTFAIIFWMNVMQLPMALAGSDPAFLAKLGAAQVLPALGIGVSGLTAHYCLTNALRSGDASVVVPIDFLRIPLIAAIGWLLYGEAVEPAVFLGALIIVSGVLWNLRAESRRY
jgi:drug/metabolite transporter (DMT)-like permease